MKLTTLLQLLLIVFCVTACNEEDERFSTISEVVMEGEENSIKISMTRSNWIVTSVFYPDGGIMADMNNNPIHLEDMGTVQFFFGSIARNEANALTIQLNDNFEDMERGFIINLGTKKGLYQEQIVVRQKRCTNFFRIESIDYSLEEGDGITEGKIDTWGITWIIKYADVVETRKIDLYPFSNSPVQYYFVEEESEGSWRWVSPEEENVDMPRTIEDGKIIFEETKFPYSDFDTYRSELYDESVEMDAVTLKTNAYRADVYHKTMRVTYTLTLSRPGDDGKKIVKGKLYKRYPYACSPIRHTVTELVD